MEKANTCSRAQPPLQHLEHLSSSRVWLLYGKNVLPIALYRCVYCNTQFAHWYKTFLLVPEAFWNLCCTVSHVIQQFGITSQPNKNSENKIHETSSSGNFRLLHQCVCVEWLCRIFFTLAFNAWWSTIIMFNRCSIALHKEWSFWWRKKVRSRKCFGPAAADAKNKIHKETFLLSSVAIVNLLHFLLPKIQSCFFSRGSE